MPISIGINLRLNLKSIAYPQALAPIVLIEIALQFLTAASEKNIHSHCLRLFYRLTYHYSLIGDLTIRPSYIQFLLLYVYQQPPKHEKAKQYSHRLQKLKFPQQDSRHHHASQYRP